MKEHVYDEFVRLEKIHWWFIGRRKYVQNLASRFRPNITKPNVLELGCGTGGNISMLSKFGDFTAIEMNEKAVGMAKKAHPSLDENIRQGYLPDNLPVDGQFDMIFMLDVLEHIEDEHDALIAVKKLVRDDGRLFLTVPAYQWLWSDHDESNQHFRRYSKSQIISVLEQQGFKVEYCSYFNTLLLPLAIIDRVKSKVTSYISREYSDTRGGPRKTIEAPNGLINKLLSATFGLESSWAGKLSMPFGLSICLVASATEN